MQSPETGLQSSWRNIKKSPEWLEQKDHEVKEIIRALHEGPCGPEEGSGIHLKWHGKLLEGHDLIGKDMILFIL